MKCRPFKPHRTWRKKIGPERREPDGERREGLDRQRQEEEDERERQVDRALRDELHGVGRRRRERQQRDAVELLENRPREDVREDVEGDVRAHAVPLRDEERLLVVAELPLLDDEDDFVHDLAGEERFEVADPAEARPAVRPADLAAVVVVEVSRDPEAPVRVRFHEVRELRRLRSGPHEQHGAEVVAARSDPPREEPQRNALGREKEKRHDAEDDEEPAAHELEPQPVDEEGQERGAAERHLRDRPDLFAERQRAVAAPEADRVEHRREDRQDEEDEDRVALEGGRDREHGRQEAREDARDEERTPAGEPSRPGRAPPENSDGDGTGFLFQHETGWPRRGRGARGMLRDAASASKDAAGEHRFVAAGDVLPSVSFIRACSCPLLPYGTGSRVL